MQINNATVQKNFSSGLGSTGTTQTSNQLSAPSSAGVAAGKDKPASIVSISARAYSLYNAQLPDSPDTTRPSATQFNPADGASGVSTDSNITISFSEAIQRGKGSIVIRNAEGQMVESFRIASSNRVSVSGNTLIIDPKKDLAGNTKYYITFSARAIQDLAGNDYASTQTYDFKTGAAPDKAAPVITTLSPQSGASNVSTRTGLSLKFSEAIQRGTGYITLKTKTGQIVESFDAATSSQISITNNTLSIRPSNELAKNTKYVVSFDRGAITDLAGNQYAGPKKTYGFKTEADKTAPVVTAYSPADGSSDASPTSNITLTFSEAIQRGKGSIVIKDANGNTFETIRASSTRLAFAGNTLTIDPVKNLAPNTKYSIALDPGTVKDLAKNSYAGTQSYDFRTAPAPSSGGSSNFNIETLYSGEASFQTFFDQAKAIWERVITGDLPDVGAIDDLAITAVVNNIDGLGGVLGQAGPTAIRGNSNLPAVGSMTFDSADMANMMSNGTLLPVILHEMGHVLGLGTLWSTFGYNSTSGQYTGSQALAMYRTMSGNPGASYVPLETGGGPGTANVHWSEAVFDTELMTGYAESNGNMPLSRLTIAALADLGYQVNYSAADSYTLA